MAGRIALDLKQFKHLRSDNKTTTLRHKDGHELTLAHNALSPEYRQQLSALSKIPGDAQTTTQHNEARQHFAEGEGKISSLEQKNSIQEEAKPGSSTREYEPIDKTTNVYKRPADGGVNAPSKIPQSGHIGVKQPDPKNNAAGFKFAGGGQVQQNPDLQESEKMPPMPPTRGYAEGPVDGMVSPDDGAPQVLAPEMQQAMAGQSPSREPAAAPPAPQPEKVAPILQATRDKYNQLAGATPGDPNAPMVDPGMFNFGANGEPPKSFKPEVWQQAEQAVKSDADGQQAARTQQQANVEQQNSVRARAGLPPLPVPPAPPSATASMEGQQTTPSQPVQNPASGAPVQQQPKGNPVQDAEGSFNQGLKEKEAGITASAQAEGDLGAIQSKALEKNVRAQQTAQDAYQKTYAALETERQGHMQDIQNGHIDPAKYWTGWTDSAGNKHDGHSKIASAIGMILAGFNPTNNPNAAIGFLKSQMDMNLDAQKHNLSAEQNLLTANLKQFGNAKDAMDMTRLMQNDMMQNELAKAAANAKSPQAKAAALQAQGQLKMDAAPLQQSFAMRRAMIGLAANPNQDPAAIDHMLGYMRVTNPEMAKEMESRYVPGIGLASVPVPDNARQEITAKQGLDAAGRDLLNYSKHNTNLIPGTAAYNYGVTKALTFQQKVREGLLGTVFRESEKPLLEQFVKENPAGALKAFNTQPQLRAILDSNGMGLNILKRNYGLPAQGQAGPSQEGPVKGKDGKMYIQQGQYMVPYKGK